MFNSGSVCTPALMDWIEAVESEWTVIVFLVAVVAFNEFCSDFNVTTFMYFGGIQQSVEIGGHGMENNCCCPSGEIIGICL